MKFQGPRFPSYVDPPTGSGVLVQKDRALPMGKQYVAHNGKKARLRYMTQQTKLILKSADAETQAACDRLRLMTKDEPEPEYGFMHLLLAAKEAADGAGVTLIQSIDYMVDKWEESSHSTAELVDEVKAP